MAQSPHVSSDEPVPALWRELAPLLPRESEPARWSGPRWWWAGRLDVEGLALGSLQALATAVSAASPSAGAVPDISLTSGGAAAAFSSFAHLRINTVAPVGFAPLSGFRPTADGWVRLHANYPHHERALLQALEVTTTDDVDAALRDRTAVAVEESVTARGGLAVRVRSPEEWAGSAPGQSLLDEPWIRFNTVLAPSLQGRGRAGSVLLDGVRVLDLTRVIAGPSGSRVLGALGADVLRVDPPELPELIDQYVDTGFAKRSAVADFKQPDNMAQVRLLLAEADIVLTAYRGSSLARYGLDAASLRADFPGLAVVSLDAWGNHGPWAERRGFDSIVQAATGISHIYASGQDGNSRPGALPVQALDHATGLGMAAAAVALLSARAQGLSGSAHLSLARTAMELMRFPGPPPGTEERESDVLLHSCRSDYGDLTFVPPPLLIDGRQLHYSSPPPSYGSAPLSWRR